MTVCDEDDGHYDDADHDIDDDHNDDNKDDNDDHDNDDDHDDDDDDNARWGRSAGEGHGRSLSVSCLQ